MPKHRHGNIFTNWFKSSKQNKQQKNKAKPQKFQIKSNETSIEQDDKENLQEKNVKRSPLIPRAATNEARSDLSPRRRASIFGISFSLASSAGSSRLSLLSGHNNKQSAQHKSTSCIESQCNQFEQLNGSINRKCSANLENKESNDSNRSPATPPRKQSKSGSISSANFLQHLANCAAQLHPGRISPRSQAGSASSSIQNLPTGDNNNPTPTPPRSPTNGNNQQTVNNQNANNQTNQSSVPSAFHRNPSFKQTSVIFQNSQDKSSAFTPISNFSTNQTTHANNSKPYLQRQATTQQQKQIQFQQQHHSTNQSYSFQKLVYSQQSNEFNQIVGSSANIISSSGLITTINESFTESNQDSSDAEIVEVFAGEQGKKTQNDTLDLVDEQLLFGETNEKKDRPSSPAPFNLTPTDKDKQDNQQQDKNNNHVNDQCSPVNKSENVVPVKKKTSFVDEQPIVIDESKDKVFAKCKLNRSETVHRDSLKDNLIGNLKDSLENKSELNNLKERLEESNGLKRKSVDINDLVDSSEQNQLDQLDQGALEETDSFGELVNNEEDFSLYENRTGLGDDMKFLASMPELCDITFLVGETREPVCAVRAVLGSRSRVFNKLLYGQKAYSNQQYNNNPDSDLPPEKPPETRSRRSIFGRKESVDESANTNEKRSREESITGSLLRYSKSKKFKENKDTKLKLFLKRGSEPMLNGLPIHQQIQPPVHQTMIIEEFEPDVFRQLIEYIHTGCVTLQARTLLGLMNAADYYGLDELRKGCMGFVSACITVDTVCALLASAERYIQYKCTKSLVQRVLEFVDNHGNEVLSLGSFALLPEHVVRLILSREELKAEELIKFQAALQWSQRYCESGPGTADLREVIEGFFECIEFYKIPATVLMREVHPLSIVPDHIIMNALAYQADPKSIDIRKVESPNRFRRMTLPHALNISGSELLNLHRQSLVPMKSERSASTSTSGYNTECSMFSANNTSSGNLGLSSSIKRKKGERDEDGPSNEEGTSKSKSKDKKDKQSKIGKRRGSRPFRRAMTLFEKTTHS